MTDTRKPSSGKTAAPAPEQAGEQTANPWGALTASWAASMDAMTAWSQTWQSILEKRGGPAAELMTGAFSNPATLPESVVPLMDEFRRALALPRFADLPSMNSALMPSPSGSVELMMLVQQYLASMMPVWAKACENFQSEVAARRAKGESVDVLTDGMDVWNTVFDRTMMEFNRSSDFGALQQKMLRLSMQQRQDIRRRVEMVSESVDMPTRTEMLDVYERLHGLMREVHTLRREVRALKADRKERDGVKANGAAGGSDSGKKSGAGGKPGAAGLNA